VRVPGQRHLNCALQNLSTHNKPGRSRKPFGKVNNVFDMANSSGATLAENCFDSTGTGRIDSSSWTHEAFDAPGASCIFRAGVNFTFGQQQP
jgi:hypothetical protein